MKIRTHYYEAARRHFISLLFACIKKKNIRVFFYELAANFSGPQAFLRSLLAIRSVKMHPSPRLIFVILWYYCENYTLNSKDTRMCELKLENGEKKSHIRRYIHKFYCLILWVVACVVYRRTDSFFEPWLHSSPNDLHLWQKIPTPAPCVELPSARLWSCISSYDNRRHKCHFMGWFLYSFTQCFS